MTRQICDVTLRRLPLGALQGILLQNGAVLTNLDSGGGVESRHCCAHLNSDLSLPVAQKEAAGNRLITLCHFYRL